MNTNEEFWTTGYPDGAPSYVETWSISWWRLAIRNLAGWVSSALYRPIRWLDLRVGQRWHNRGCNDDCGEWTLAAAGEKRPGCVRMGWVCGLDIFHYDYLRKHGTLLITWEAQ